MFILQLIPFIMQLYLRRSSSGSNLPMFNRSKYKIQKGIKIVGVDLRVNPSIPPVFSLPRPSMVPDTPLVVRAVQLGYELLASVITPIKNISENYDLH